MTPEQKPTMGSVMKEFIPKRYLDNIDEHLKQYFRQSMKEWERISMKERDEEIKNLRHDMNGLIERDVHHMAQRMAANYEIERLKGLVKRIIPLAELLCTNCLPGDQDISVYDDIKQFKTSNNL